MTKIKIPNSEIASLISNKENIFPKYSTQLINLANQNAQGTRPSVVGQMSELIQEFEGLSFDDWETWYKEKHPDSIENASQKVYTMILLLKASIDKINLNMVREWVENLVITKTFTGLKFQEAILKKIADSKKIAYRLSTPQEESNGIDGFIGDRPVSIKPTTYKVKSSLQENIPHSMIYYEKKKAALLIEFDF